MKAGLLEEMMGEAIDGVDGEDVEEAAEEEVEKVLYELTAGVMGSMPEVGSKKLDAKAEKNEVVAAKEKAELNEMKARLENL